MALETASYIANLVVTNPDGGDARSTADDHIRLIKASLRRTFPLLDSAVSLSAAQVHYVADLSASVQLQLNTLRDGSATANFAKYANSASVAAFIGSIPADHVPNLSLTNVFAVTQVIRGPGSLALQIASNNGTPGTNSFDIIQNSSSALILNRDARTLEIGTNGNTNILIATDGTITLNGTVNGTIANATNATNAAVAAFATTAGSAGTASTATIANTCTSASSAATLAGLSGDAAATATTVALRNGAGDVFARYFNQNSGLDNVSVGHIACMTSLDGYWRPNTVANVGAYMEARNISGRTGVAKTLASGSGPPSLSGSTNGDLFYYY